MRTRHTVFDVGAQLERTPLAWIRTALALTALGGLTARCATRTAAPPLAYSVAAVLFATGVTAGMWAIRSDERRHAELHDARPVVSAAPLRCVAVTLTLASSGALGLVLT